MKMFKLFVLSVLVGALCFFSACGDKSKETDSNAQGEEKKENVIVVGATAIPHAQMLEFIKQDLADDGVELKIVEFSDYVTPNLSLDDGSLDANFLQHKPFLDSIVKERGLDLVSIGQVHIEPIGFYSDKIASLDELQDNASIAIPNDPTNGGRALILLHNQGLLKLKDVNNLSSNETDIVENPHNFKIVPVEAALLPRVIGDYEGAVINGNFALQAGKRAKDALFIEDEKSPYANIIATKTAKANDENLLKLKKALQSEKMRDFIKEKFEGEIVTAF